MGDKCGTSDDNVGVRRCRTGTDRTIDLTMKSLKES